MYHWQYNSAVCTGYFLKSTHLMARQNSAAFFSGVLCTSPSYLFSVNSCCYNRNFAFPFLYSLSSALLAKAIALAAINFLNYVTLFIAGASPILLPLPSPALLRSPLPFGMVFVVFLSSCSCHTTFRMDIRLSTYC